MAYILSESCGDSISVPQLVFSKLRDIEDDWLRVAFYIISTKITDSAVIARELRLKGPSKAREAMLFWKGAGLLAENDVPEAVLLDAPSKPARLTTREVTAASQNDKNIAELLQTSQAILGGVINETDANELVSLYLCCDIPVDMILMGVSHFAALGKKNGRYIARALQAWQQQGIDSGAACEKYLMTLEKRAKSEKMVAELLGTTEIKFTKLESSLIAEWLEGFGYDKSMIAEAIQYASDKKSIKYINGILRAWYSKGFKTAKDIQSSSANTMRNLQPSSLNASSSRDILQEAIGKIPIYRKNSDGDDK